MNLMHFKTHQALALAGITNDKLRHWKTHLSVLQFDGRKGNFDFAQVVALAVINRVVTALKVPIGTVAPHAEEIFSAVASFLRTGSPAQVWLNERSVLTSTPHEVLDTDVLIRVRIDVIAAEVSATAIGVQDGQLDLLGALGPEAVKPRSPPAIR